MRATRDLVSAIAARQRGRSRLRAATATVGLAGLATTGLIAWNLPAPAVHGTTTGTSKAAQAQPSTPATATRSQGEDDDEGRRHVITSGSATTSGTPATSHATSGGSAAVLP